MQQPVDPLLGSLIADRYRIVREIGAGGFGTVYMAEHARLKQQVAIKVLHMHLTRDQEMVARFEREADAASLLQHSAMARVFDVGLLPDGRPFMVMEYLKGETLADIIKREGPVQYSRLLPWFIQCCDALRYAHKKGMLHRDIKPDNIFVMRDEAGVEHVKLLDFGLAKLVHGDGEQPITALTQSGVTMGTPWYMSPEQCSARPLDGRTDIYSLAYSMYEAIAGRRPFPGRTHYEAMDAHLHSKLPKLNREFCDPIVPSELDSAIQKACAKSPNDRFLTADEFRTHLEKSLDASLGTMRTPLRAPVELARETLSAAGDVDFPTKVLKPRRKKLKKHSTLMLVAVLASLVGLMSTAAGVIVLHRAHEVAAAHARRPAIAVPIADTETAAPVQAAGAPKALPESKAPVKAETPPVVITSQSRAPQPTHAPRVVARASANVATPQVVSTASQETAFVSSGTPQERLQASEQDQPQQTFARTVTMPAMDPSLFEPLQFPESTLRSHSYITEEMNRPRICEQPPANYGSYQNTTLPPVQIQNYAPGGVCTGGPFVLKNAGPTGPMNSKPFVPSIRR